MFPGTIKTGLSLSKVISGVSKTLNVANQMFPLYMQAKPIIQNARGTLKIAKEFLTPPKQETTKQTLKMPDKNTPQKIQNKTKKESIAAFQTSGPIFFL